MKKRIYTNPETQGVRIEAPRLLIVSDEIPATVPGYGGVFG